MMVMCLLIYLMCGLLTTSAADYVVWRQTGQQLPWRHSLSFGLVWPITVMMSIRVIVRTLR